MNAIRYATPSRRKRVALVAVASLIVLYFLMSAHAALVPFIIGLLFAFLLSPLVRRFQAMLPVGWPEDRRRFVAVIGVYILVLAIFILLGMFALPPLVSQIDHFIELLPTMVQEAQSLFSSLTERYQSNVPPELRERLDTAIAEMGIGLAGALQDAAFKTVLVVSQTFSLLLGLFTVPVWLFYILKDQPKITAFFYNLLPEGSREVASNVTQIITRTISSYVRGQLLLGLIVGTSILIGLTILQVPFAIVLGIVAGITEMIPVLGPFLGAIPALLVTFTNAPDKLFVVTLFFIGVQLVENTLLVPRIQGHAVSLHPAVIMILLVLASEVAGFMGMLVAVPLVAVGRDVFLYLYQQTEEEEQKNYDVDPRHPSEGPTV